MDEIAVSQFELSESQSLYQLPKVKSPLFISCMKQSTNYGITFAASHRASQHWF